MASASSYRAEVGWASPPRFGVTAAWAVVGVALASLITVAGAYTQTPAAVAALSVGLAATCIIAWRPIYGVYGALLLMPLTASKLQLGEGASLSPSVGILILTAAIYGVRALAGVSHPRPSWVHGAFAGFLVIALLGITVAEDGATLLKVCFVWSCLLIVSIFIASARRSEVRSILVCAAIGAGVLGLESISSSSSPRVFQGGFYATGRAASGFSLPNILALFFVLTVPAAVVMASTHRQRPVRVIMLACVGLGLIGVVETLSREGAIGILATMVVLCFWQPIRRAVMAAILVLLVLTIAGVGPLASHQVATLETRLGTVGESASNDPRPLIWRFSVQIFEAHPLLGVGEGNFPKASAKIPGATLYGGQPVTHAHNLVLQIAAETGALGLFAFLSFLFLLLRTTWRARRTLDRQIVPETLALGAALVGFLVSDIFGYGLDANQITCILLIYAGCIVALDRGLRSQRYAQYRFADA